MTRVWKQLIDSKLDTEFPIDEIIIDYNAGDIRISLFRENHYQNSVIINTKGIVVNNDID